MPWTAAGPQRRAESAALDDRLKRLRIALHDITDDNARLRRELARLRTENRELRTSLGNICSDTAEALPAEVGHDG